MEQLVVAGVLAIAVGGVAIVVRRRQRGSPAAPTQPRHAVPAQLDRADFAEPAAPWLVAVFTSATCLSCHDTWEKARSLAARGTVVVENVEASDRSHLHQRYGIDAVPIVVVADSDGVVRASFVGPPSAADLWATVAELREPGSVPPACDHHASAPGAVPAD
ncbi:MAG: hypothetical protein ACRD29_19260 [Acidimicrobiales bacterium]